MGFAGSDERGAARRDPAMGLYALAGLGDIGVGALVLVYPPVLGWLIGQPLDAGASIAARLLGCAAVALGLGWWSARREPETRAALQPGMLAYNFGAGVVFVLAARLAPAPLVPALVGALHLGLGVATVLIPARRTQG